MVLHFVGAAFAASAALLSSAAFLSAAFLSSAAFAQQEYVSRYDAFAGFSYLNSPTLNLAERGFNAEFGVNVTRWLALGADYSIFTGHSAIRPQDLTPALQLQLLPILPLLGRACGGYQGARPPTSKMRSASLRCS